MGSTGTGGHDLRRARLRLLWFAVPVLVIKLVIAGTTFGTNDIIHWGDFVAGVRQAGPVGIYGLTFPNDSFYNHPPLIGYLLWFVNRFQDIGIPYRFTLRAISSSADVGTAFVVFELLRRRRTLRQALLAAVMVATSPVLIMVSGFHGNTDPIFVLLVLLGLLLLVDRRMPVLAGIAIGLAIGIKIVPMVVIPALVVFAFRRDRGEFLRWAVGFVATFLITWGPALIGQFRAVRLDVIGYSGIGYSPWGIEQIGHWLGDPGWVADFAGPGRSIVVVICAVVPAVAVWRRPSLVVPAVAWSLIGFLVLAPTWGIQYMVWPTAAAYLIGLKWGNIYNAAAGVLLFCIYTRWSGGLPWYQARATWVVPFYELVLMMAVWVALVVVFIRATIKIFPPGAAGFDAEPDGSRRVGKARMRDRATEPDTPVV